MAVLQAAAKQTALYKEKRQADACLFSLYKAIKIDVSLMRGDAQTVGSDSEPRRGRALTWEALTKKQPATFMNRRPLVCKGKKCIKWKPLRVFLSLQAKRIAHQRETSHAPQTHPQKVGSKPKRRERVYKRTAKAQRDFLRRGGATA